MQVSYPFWFIVFILAHFIIALCAWTPADINQDNVVDGLDIAIIADNYGRQRKVIRLSWQPNSESNLAGYKIYAREDGTEYDMTKPVCDLGNITRCEVDSLDERKTWFFIATAYDIDGNESDPSNEVRWKND